MSVAWSYPVTPSAALALSGAFDKENATKAFTSVSHARHTCVWHASMDASGGQVDGRGFKDLTLRPSS